ncbi:MAG: hypothetical protein HDR25_03330 [Lachnospiraceae bacterium]|nr:hypothetical protein [Lachnospiraceae bacterium]
MKKKAVIGLVAALCLGSSMTAFAAPEVMPDGTVFDAEYYAENNPDVVAAMGTDKDAMYLHYVVFGANEGRRAYGENTVVPVIDAEESTVAPVIDAQGMTLPYFKIICNEEIKSVTLSLEQDDLFYARDNLMDASAGIDGKTFMISNLYLPDNYFEFVHETGDVWSTPIPRAYDFNEGLLYSPETEDVIPEPIVFEPDGGVIFNCNSL